VLRVRSIISSQQREVADGADVADVVFRDTVWTAGAAGAARAVFSHTRPGGEMTKGRNVNKSASVRLAI